MDIAKESLPTFIAGQGTVGLNEIPLCITQPINKFVVVKADPGNLNWIMVGRRGAAHDGFPLLANEQTPPIYVETTDAIGLVAGGPDQHFSFLLS